MSKSILCLPASFLLPVVLAAHLGHAAATTAPSASTAAQPPRVLTLREAVATALRSNPMMGVAASGRRMAEERLSEARAGWFPQLALSETFTRSNNPVFVFGSLLEQARFGAENFSLDALNDPGPLNNFRTALTLRVPLFDQLQTSTGVAQARIAGDRARSQTDLVEQQLRFGVIRAYYGVLVAQGKKDVADEAVNLAQAETQRAQNLFETGLVVQADLLAAQVQLAEYRQEQIQARGEVATAQAALNTALGLPVVVRHQVSGSLSERSFVVPPQEELLEQALQNRGDYKSAAFSVRSAEEGARGARAQYLPRWDAFGTWGGSGHHPGVDSSDYTLGTSITLNLLDLGRNGRIGQARAAVALAEAQRQHAANQIGLEVVQAYQQYLSARERVGVASEAVDQAVAALRIVRDRYEVGLTTITEVLRAQTALVRMRLNRLAAQYDHYVGYAGLRMAVGTLRDVDPFEP